MMGELTIKDIAKECGVGVSTVSRAINNHPDINPETRKKIMDTIAEKGFTPNNSARNLKRTETNSIALLGGYDQDHGGLCAEEALYDTSAACRQ